MASAPTKKGRGKGKKTPMRTAKTKKTKRAVSEEETKKKEMALIVSRAKQQRLEEENVALRRVHEAQGIRARHLNNINEQFYHGTQQSLPCHLDVRTRGTTDFFAGLLPSPPSFLHLLPSFTSFPAAFLPSFPPFFHTSFLPFLRSSFLSFIRPSCHPSFIP